VHAAGWSAHHLHCVRFLPPDSLPPDSPGAFGFVDPFDIICGVYMILAFAHGTTNKLGKSVAQRPADDGEDWQILLCWNVRLFLYSQMELMIS